MFTGTWTALKRLQFFDSSVISKAHNTFQKLNFSIFRRIIFKKSNTLKKCYRKINVKLAETSENNNEPEKTNSNNNATFTDNLIKWAVQNNISNIAFSKLLKVLIEYGIKDLPASSKALLLAKEGQIKVLKMPPGTYTHFGFHKNLKSLMLALIEKNILKETDISVSVFIDQLPLVKHTQQSLWVILASVEGFIDNVFFIGAYWGYSKPSSSNLFLSEFLKEAKDLTEKGIKINDIVYNVKIKRLICDAPAKCFALNIKYLTSYSSCIKCNTVGEFKSKKMCFLEKSTPRKDEDFEKNEMYIDSKTCLLEIPNFGVVSNVVIDYMHLVCLGVVKKLLSIWLNSDEYWISQSSASDMMKGLASVYPCEFQEKPKGLKPNRFWTANNFRQFLLYCGPVVLKNNLKENYYNHFLLLHLACRLLCTEASTENINYGRQFLNDFVKNYKNLYKAEKVTYNIHGLYHLADECITHGILDNFSSFPFEKFLVKLKSKLKKNKKKLVPQIILRESYNKIFSNSLARLSSDNYSVKKKIKISENNQFQNFSHYEKLSFQNFNIIPSSDGDNYVFLKNGKIIEVTSVLKKREKPEGFFIAGKEWNSVSSFYSGEFESLKLGMFIIKELSDTVKLWSIDLIEKKGMKIPIGNGEFVVISLLDKNF